jgi:hypothetical protein
MGIQEEQEQRRELLLRALEACPNPERALAMALRMEQFIIDGQTSREEPHEATQPVVQPASEQPRKTCNRSRWTGDDDAHLRRLWQGNLTVEEIAQELHRTPASIYARVRILDLSSSKHVAKNGKRKTKLSRPHKQSPSANSKETNGLEAVGIDSVVHFLRTRDYTVVLTEDHSYELDGRKTFTAQELFERANRVRDQLKRPMWGALVNAPKIDGPHKSKH